MADFYSQQGIESEVSKAHGTPGGPTGASVGKKDGDPGVGSIDQGSLSSHRSSSSPVWSASGRGDTACLGAKDLADTTELLCSLA